MRSFKKKITILWGINILLLVVVAVMTSLSIQGKIPKLLIQSVSDTYLPVEEDNTLEELVSEQPNVTKAPLIEETPTVEVTNKPNVTSEPEEQTITLVFTGDVLLSQSTLGAFEKGGMNGLISNDLVELMNRSDITMVNQEFPFSVNGTPMEDKQYTFRADPSYVSILQSLGVDIVSLANNHALDYGQEALLDTFTTLDSAKIDYVGAGETLNRAKEVQYKQVNGKKFAFVGASRVIPTYDWNANNTRPGMLTTYDPTITLEQLKLADKNADFVVVYVHWGVEKAERPESYQRELAKKYIDAGADLVVGSHTHCLQGVEYYKGKPILYSLGNFIFGATIDRTAIAKVVIDQEMNVTLSMIPCYANSAKTLPLSDELAKEEFRRYMESISNKVKINEDNEFLNVS